MIGLPFEELTDIESIVNLANRLKDFMETNGSTGKLTLSVNPFIPKPFTPFQWSPIANKKYIDDALKIIRSNLKRKNIEIIAESPRESYIQAILARGDRRIAEVLLHAHINGGIKSFKNALIESNTDAKFYLFRTRNKDEIFPWDTLNMGFNNKYLYNEFMKAATLQITKSCSDGCKRCGVC